MVHGLANPMREIRYASQDGSDIEGYRCLCQGWWIALFGPDGKDVSYSVAEVEAAAAGEFKGG